MKTGVIKYLARSRWAFGLGGFALWLAGALLLGDRLYPPSLARFRDVSTVVVDKDGQILRAFLSDDDKWRLPVERADVDPHYLEMLKAYEDKRFDRHWGVDPLALTRAVAQWAVNGRVISGASTLTMQTVRLLEPRPRTLRSKMIEIARAMQLEAHYDKDEILEFYLTLAPFGGNLEGVRAASLSYFEKEPARLTLAEASLLVALPQSPERQRPDRNHIAAKEGRAKVIASLLDRHFISSGRAGEALGERIPRSRLPFPLLAPRLARHLATEHDGPIVRTRIDGNVQKALEEVIRSESEWYDDGASIAVVIIENVSRDLIAYAGGGDFWAPAGQVDLARAARSPGSALKPFIYALAFDDLTVHPETLIEDRPMVFGDYAPQNFDRNYQGTVSLRQALRQSLNVPAVALLDRVGPVRLSSSFSDAGARLSYARAGTAPSLPLALGGVGISLLDLTSLYTILANGGEMAPVTISDYDTPKQPRQLISQAAAWYVSEILRGSPMPDGWAQRFGIDRWRHVAFKTGTSYGFRDAWSAGYSGSYTVGVWAGRADGSARPRYFGRNTAAPILLRVFDLLPAESRSFLPRPENALKVNDRRELPANMHRFRAREVSQTARSEKTPPPPVIRFPANGVTVALSRAGEDATLALKAVGGARPLRWLVNGDILPQTAFLETTFWQPEGLGFAEVVVVDALGRSAKANIRLREPH